jgi:hypothetical protein
VNAPDFVATSPAPARGAHATSVHTQATTQQQTENQAQEQDSQRLEELLADRRERHDLKLDYAATIEEAARLAAQDLDYALAHWFDEQAARVRDCANVRVVPHVGCSSQGGSATPFSCHVRGEPDCERARAGRLVAEYTRHAVKADDPKFLTLTIANVPIGELATGIARITAALSKLKRRSIIGGGPCRNMWPERGPTGERDGAPVHPCHSPEPSPGCRGPKCAPGCKRGAVPYADHQDDCDLGCPTRTGRHQSRCQVHPPHLTHAEACPPDCRHVRHRKDRNCPDFKHRPVVGGISAIDLTFNEAERSWHPHLHCLIDGPWIIWAELSRVWLDLTCTSPRCRHERLPSGSPDPDCMGSFMVWISNVPTDEEGRVAGAVREVLKYVAKPHGVVDSLDPGRIGEYLLAMRGRRTVTGWGTFADASAKKRCPKACPPNCPKVARKWCQPHDCPNAHRGSCAAHRPRGTDVHEIDGVFQRLYVPKICPSCGAQTGPEDWATPVSRSRLESFRDRCGHYGWRPPAAYPPGATPGERVASLGSIPDSSGAGASAGAVL